MVELDRLARTWIAMALDGVRTVDQPVPIPERIVSAVEGYLVERLDYRDHRTSDQAPQIINPIQGRYGIERIIVGDSSLQVARDDGSPETPAVVLGYQGPYGKLYVQGTSRGFVFSLDDGLRILSVYQFREDVPLEPLVLSFKGSEETRALNRSMVAAGVSRAVEMLAYQNAGYCPTHGPPKGVQLHPLVEALHDTTMTAVKSMTTLALHRLWFRSR